ncbi:hypothetical protein EYF80_010410 [Liparis tanakae]|uniref:Uncharacterized protein n=1 Tax=Liparis tanakae TaxID=230148 RepID=A0A4Z2INE4_9TELE|nr:hypothetical protein EYF80_010410 [Liparis tanakae]
MPVTTPEGQVLMLAGAPPLVEILSLDYEQRMISRKGKYQLSKFDILDDKKIKLMEIRAASKSPWGSPPANLNNGQCGGGCSVDPGFTGGLHDGDSQRKRRGDIIVLTMRNDFKLAAAEDRPVGRATQHWSGKQDVLLSFFPGVRRPGLGSFKAAPKQHLFCEFAARYSHMPSDPPVSNPPPQQLASQRGP